MSEELPIWIVWYPGIAGSGYYQAKEACDAAIQEAVRLNWERELDDDFIDLEVKKIGDKKICKLSVERIIEYRAEDLTKIKKDE